MIENDCGVWKRPGKLRELGELGVIAPALETEAPRRQVSEPLAEFGVTIKSRRRTGAMIGYSRVVIPGGGLPDAPEPTIAGSQLRVEDPGHGVACTETRCSHDTRCDSCGAVVARGAHCSQTIGKLGLADGPHFSGTAQTPHRTALDKDAGNHIVAATGVGKIFIQQVAAGDVASPVVPQVMVGITDRQRSVECLFVSPGEPVVVRCRFRHGLFVGRGRDSSQPIPLSY